MTTLENVKSRISMVEASSSVKAKRWLERENPETVSTEPALVTARQALHLWKLRLETSRSRHQGMQELVKHLEQMSPQSQVEQYSFKGKGSTALLFFKKRDRTFLGSIVIEK